MWSSLKLNGTILIALPAGLAATRCPPKTSRVSLGTPATTGQPHWEDEHMWVLVAISAVTLVLHTLLLLALYIMLTGSRSRGESGSPAAQPPQPPQSPAARRATYAGSSDTSSSTSEDSEGSPACPQVWPESRKPCSEANLNYTSLVFPGPGRGPGSAADYENMKTGADYINVDPKKRKADFWPCPSPVASIEYSEVKL
ncbi:PREDICTED: uncharacterized protein C1orf186 homolog [Chaetura pelagica]|uniref:uncharacterized protein C1orf186 homolog n=1 Tax=Chaetura pelagica TaxID=8897 RepID=UPI000523412F|nr:PREDICTED: uncharacterized protein C1orf186 homolog [Chaetura pelagica]